MYNLDILLHPIYVPIVGYMWDDPKATPDENLYSKPQNIWYSKGENISFLFFLCNSLTCEILHQLCGLPLLGNQHCQPIRLQ